MKNPPMRSSSTSNALQGSWAITGDGEADQFLDSFPLGDYTGLTADLLKTGRTISSSITEGRNGTTRLERCVHIGRPRAACASYLLQRALRKLAKRELDGPSARV